jgi:hypothetical protein
MTNATPLTAVVGWDNSDAVLTAFCKEHGIKMSAIGKAEILTNLAGRMRLVGNGLVKFGDQDQDLLTYLQTLSASPMTASYFERTTDSNTVAASNPWRKGAHWSVTEQHAIERRDPKLAVKLQGEAAGAPRTTGNDPANPWTKAGWNLTSQMLLERTDPAKAAQLQAAS